MAKRRGEKEKQKILKYAETHTWAETTKKFNVASSVVHYWRRTSAPKKAAGKFKEKAVVTANPTLTSRIKELLTQAEPHEKALTSIKKQINLLTV